MKLLHISYLLCLLSLAACAQSSSESPQTQPVGEKHIGGPCEGCEAIFERPIPFSKLHWIDTLPDYGEPGPKILISGIVYKTDGKTPAKDVVLYIYHTGQDGKYTNKYNEKGLARAHGYIRGWMKTNEKGQYKFYTLMPAYYPGSTTLKHIHPSVKEPVKMSTILMNLFLTMTPFLQQNDEGIQEQTGAVMGS